MASTHQQQLQHQRLINNTDSPDNNYYDNARRQQLMQYACGTILTCLIDKAFQGMSPQQFGWLKHPRA